jgi:hypothetical protein
VTKDPGPALDTVPNLWILIPSKKSVSESSTLKRQECTHKIQYTVEILKRPCVMNNLELLCQKFVKYFTHGFQFQFCLIFFLPEAGVA